MFIYLTYAIFVVILITYIYQIIKTKDKIKRINLSLLGVSILIFSASILYVELSGDYDSNKYFPFFAIVPAIISGSLASRNRTGVTDKKLNKFLILAMLLGLLVLMIITSLYIMK